MICASVYLLVFIRNLLVHLAEEILLFAGPQFRGGLPPLSHAILRVKEFIVFPGAVMLCAIGHGQNTLAVGFIV